MKVICSLLLLAPCLSALMISCCKYFLINVKLRDFIDLVLIKMSAKAEQQSENKVKFALKKGKSDNLTLIYH